MNKYILSLLYDFPTEQAKEAKQGKKKKTGKKSKQENVVKDPGPIIKGYLSKTAPFDFNVFTFNPDDDDEKRFYIRKLFSQFQKLDYIKKYKEGQIVEENETGHNYITDEQYARIRIHNILMSLQQLNHFTYSICHSEEKVFLILQYGTMLIQVASFEVNLEFHQINRQYSQRDDNTEEFYNFHLNLYEEIFVFIDFIQKNRLDIAQCLKSYGEKIFSNIIDLNIDSRFLKHYKLDNVFDLNKYNEIKNAIEESIKISLTSNFSKNLNKHLNYLSQLDFCLTLYYFIASEDFLYSFTKEYTDIDDLMDPLLELYKFDYDLFANSPTYFRLFFCFFQSEIYEKNELIDEKNRLKHIFDSFQFTIQEFYNHLFFGHYNKYAQPLSYKLEFMEKKDYDEKMDSISSLFSYSKAAHMFSSSPLSIYSAERVQYVFYPIAETALNILSNQLNSWCIHVSETYGDKLSIDLPDVLLKYIRHWTAHEYLLYQQCGIKVKGATRMAIQQNVTPSAINEISLIKLIKLKKKGQTMPMSYTQQQKKKAEFRPILTQQNINEIKEEEPKTEELSKTYRVISHYASFLTSIIKNQIINLEYKKSANSFYILKNEPSKSNQKVERIHSFLNFCQLYKLAQILGPAGIKFILTKVVIHDFNLSVKELIDKLLLIEKSNEQEKQASKYNKEIAEYLAKIGNLSYLRELLKFVTQTYIRNYHPTLYKDLYINACKDNKNNNSYDELIDLFDMEEDCKLIENLYDKEKKDSKLSKLKGVDKLIIEAFSYLKSDNSKSDNSESPKSQISNLAIARGMDEFFSLLYYYNYLIETKPINNIDSPKFIDEIKNIHEDLIDNINQNSKMSSIAKAYFHESSYFHQDFSIYHHTKINDNTNSEINDNFIYAGQKRKRGTPYDSFLIDTIEWIDIVKNLMGEEKNTSSKIQKADHF